MPHVYMWALPGYTYSYVVTHCQLCMPALTRHALASQSSAGAELCFDAVSVDTPQLPAWFIPAVLSLSAFCVCLTVLTAGE